MQPYSHIYGSTRKTNPSHLPQAPETSQEARRADEKKLREKGADAPFPGFDRLFAESVEQGPKVLIVVSDPSGRSVRRLEAPARAGLHRVSWDLRGPSPEPIDLRPPGFRPPWGNPPKGPLVAPGRYTARLAVVSASGVRTIGVPQPFEVKPVDNVPAGTDFTEVAAFQEQVSELRRRTAAADEQINDVRDQLRHMRAALLATPGADPAILKQLDAAHAALAGLTRRLNGDPARQRLHEPDAPSIAGRVWSAMNTWETRQPPTATQRRDFDIATTEIASLTPDLQTLVNGDIARLRAALTEAGAPYTPRR